jgi:SAM-dependent methyltransferase
VAAARSSITDRRAQFAVADATALLWKNGACAVAVAGLALNFIADPHEAMCEMIRVTQPAGKVAVYVWDYQRGMEMLRYFWDAVVAIDPAAASRDEGTRFPLCQPAPLAAIFAAAGLKAIEVRAIVIAMAFRSFDAY